MSENNMRDKSILQESDSEEPISGESVLEESLEEPASETVLIPVLKVKSQNGDINIVAKYGGEVSIKPINVKFIIANLWWEKAPELETFFNVLELTVKRAMNEVYPHHKLVIDYTYTANDLLKDASEIVVEIDYVKVDDTDVAVEGDSIILLGNDDRGFFKKLTSRRRKVMEKVHKEI